MAIPTTNVSFSSIYNAINNPDHNGTDAISLSSFRGQTFTTGPAVPASGAISIDPDFKGRTPSSNMIPDGTYQFPPTAGSDSIWHIPYYGLYDYSQGGMIYLKEDIETATDTVGKPGHLMGIAFQWDGYTNGYRRDNQTIKISHVIGDSGFPDPGYPDYRTLALKNTTTVKEDFSFWTYNNFSTFVDFDIGFDYNGVNNILISWENRDGDWQSGYGRVKGRVIPSDRSHAWYRDGSYPTSSSSNNKGVPNIKFKFITP